MNNTTLNGFSLKTSHPVDLLRLMTLLPLVLVLTAMVTGV